MGDGVDLQSKLMPSVSEERPHELAGAILQNSARSSPYRVRRSCKGEHFFSLPLKFLGGVGDFFQEVPRASSSFSSHFGQ